MKKKKDTEKIKKPKKQKTEQGIEDLTKEIKHKIKSLCREPPIKGYSNNRKNPQR